jgi:predicted RNase H-like HicB family nuclease
METIRVFLEKGKDGYGVSFDAIPNVFGFGETLEAAKQDAKDALTGFAEVLKKHGKPVPKALQGEYKLAFEFETDTLLDYISGTVTQMALSKAAGVNPSQIRQYVTHRKKPRPEQRLKIVKGLHKIGHELLAVS